VDADTGQIIAAELTRKDVDDGSQVGPLLEQIAKLQWSDWAKTSSTGQNCWA
jgi:hypothetical protein